MKPASKLLAKRSAASPKPPKPLEQDSDEQLLELHRRRKQLADALAATRALRKSGSIRKTLRSDVGALADTAISEPTPGEPGTIKVRVVEAGGPRPLPLAKVTVELWSGQQLLSSEQTNGQGLALFEFRKREAEPDPKAQPAQEQVKQVKQVKQLEQAAPKPEQPGEQQPEERRIKLGIRVLDLAGKPLAEDHVLVSANRPATKLVHAEPPERCKNPWPESIEVLETIAARVSDIYDKGFDVHIKNLETMIEQLDRAIARRKC